MYGHNLLHPGSYTTSVPILFLDVHHYTLLLFDNASNNTDMYGHNSLHPLTHHPCLQLSLNLHHPHPLQNIRR